MTRTVSCSTCTAELDEDKTFIVHVKVKRLNGDTTGAEIEVCKNCMLDLDCIVLLDDEDGMTHPSPSVRERIPT